MILPLMEQDRQITFGEVFAMDAALSGLETGPVIS